MENDKYIKYISEREAYPNRKNPNDNNAEYIKILKHIREEKVTFRLIEEFYVAGAYEFFNNLGVEIDIESAIEDAGADNVLIEESLEKKYPNCHIIVDFLETKEIFHCRVFKVSKDIS